MKEILIPFDYGFANEPQIEYSKAYLVDEFNALLVDDQCQIDLYGVEPTEDPEVFIIVSSGTRLGIIDKNDDEIEIIERLLHWLRGMSAWDFLSQIQNRIIETEVELDLIPLLKNEGRNKS